MSAYLDIRVKWSYFGMMSKVGVSMLESLDPNYFVRLYIDSTTEYRDAGKILIYADANNSSAWPDSTRNIIAFGGTLTGGNSLGLPSPAILIALRRRKVLVDLSSVNFNGRYISVYNGSTLVTTISSPGVYEFLLLGSKYIKL